MPDLLTDETGHIHALSIPPPLIRGAVVEAMRRAADATLPPQFAAVVRATAQPFLQPVYDLESARMAFGRVALLGDSAFIARRHRTAEAVMAETALLDF